MATSADSLISSLLQQPGLIGQAFQQGQQANDQHAQASINQQIGQQEVQQNAGLLNAQAAQQQQNQQYGQWWQQYVANPTDAMLRQGVAQFPSRWKDIQAQKSALEAPARQSQNLIFGQVWNAAKNGRVDLVAENMQRVIDAEQAAKVDTSEAERTLAAVKSGDKDALKAVQAFVQVHLAAGDPEFAKAMGIGPGRFSQLGSGGVLNENTGDVVREPDSKPDKPEYQYDPTNQRWLLKPGSGGAGAVAGDVGGGASGDVSRLINTDAGGGYVPAGVDTLGKFVAFGKSLNAKGAKSSSAGTYQINGSTMAEFAPKALGPGWKSAPFNADTQEKVGEAIFDWAKTQPNPAAALRGRWVSLSPQAAAQAVQGSWEQARGMIAQGETGGGAGASANAGGGRSPSFGSSLPGVISVPAAGKGAGADDGSTGAPFLATLPTGRATLIQSIIDGKQAAPKPGSRFGEALAEDLARADPSFDPSLQPARMQARKDFTGNGRAAQVASSGNRLAYHLNDLWRDSRALSGPDLGWSPLSNLATGAAQSFQQAAVARYNAVLPFISGELQKLTKNGQSTEGETNKIIQNLRPNQPTAVREAAIQQVVDLATGQFKPFRNQWDSAFQGKPPPVDFTPTTQKIFARIAAGEDALHVDQNGNEIDSRHAGRRQAGAGQPVRVVSIQQAMALPKGTVFLAPDGRRKVR